MNDAQMLLKLFEYALNESDQPAENPVTVWLEGHESAYPVGPQFSNEDAPDPAATNRQGDDPVEWGDRIDVYDFGGGAFQVQIVRDFGSAGFFHLNRHAVDDARGIARRKGVIGPKPDEGMTLAEAAEKLKLRPDTLRRQIRQGRLRGVKRGRDWFVTPAAVDHYREFHQGRVGRPAIEESAK